MRYALKPFYTGEWDDSVNVGVLDLTPDFARRLLELIDLHAKFAQQAGVETWDLRSFDLRDYSVGWYKVPAYHNDEVEQFVDKLWSEELVAIPEDHPVCKHLIPANEANMESSRLEVYRDEVMWRAFLKYTDIEFSHAQLTVGFLTDFLAKAAA